MSQQHPPSSSDDHDPWFTSAEAARYAKVSIATLRRAYQSGALQSCRIPNGRSLRFRRSWIDIWILKGAGPPMIAAILALLISGWLLACAYGLDHVCHIQRLLEEIERRV